MRLRENQVDTMWRKLGYDVQEHAKDVKAILKDGTVIVAFSRRSHGSGKLEGVIPHKIRNQMKLNESQFADAYNCPMKQEQYFAILREKGFMKAVG